mmetsp:Transcript_12407/g.18792  ORF Transcript_12407/g.18792 Transcript_12407/m.18792 type:complete len:887 (+) Transcript_12407:81-2741(+)
MVEAASARVEVGEDEPSHESQLSSKVASESYPIAQPLVTILRAAVKPEANTSVGAVGSNGSGGKNVEIILETVEDALQNIIRNCFVAMDEMFFYTPMIQRNKASFQHRLCIRISTCTEKQTLTITDLGSGMTRSDLINSLGVGSRLSEKVLIAARHLNSTASSINNGQSDKRSNSIDSNLHDDDTSSSVSSEKEDYESDESDDNDDTDIDSDDENSLQFSKSKITIPCKATDVGGFYSAFCALGTSVEIGTKSKFDDYYVFQLSRNVSDDEEDCEEEGEEFTFSKFKISRPMKEGTKPTSLNGYDKFTDVRGESGTRITIQLNQKAIQAGLLNQSQTLKPLLTKFLESSQYNVVLEDCCVDENERNDIITASEREMEENENTNGDNGSNDVGEDMDTFFNPDEGNSEELSIGLHNTVKERSKYIPLRLSMGERKMLRLVEAAMLCCDYTTDVDKQFKSSTRRTHCQLKKITSVLRGMVSSCDYGAGQRLLSIDNDDGEDPPSFSDYDNFFRQMFEIARRHKIMNPEKMRSEYGKLIYLLQDAVSPYIKPHLSFSCKGPIETVYKFLEEKDGLAVLDDKLIDIATREILAEKKTRAQITHEIKRKEKAVSILKQKYCTRLLSSEDIHLCLYSICDNDSFLNSNRVPIDKVIGYLQHFFSPSKIEDGYSLSIVSGQDGSRLSHSHERQFYFALQSLTLWRDIIDDMFRLWAMAEEDLLSESITYSLKDTGQGMQRVQQSPLTYKSMQRILSRVQGKVNQWIGSNVIHLGDHNVPNALTFIDKYTQVPRILSPIVTCLENLERICEEDDGVNTFIETGFGGVEQVKKDILYDFFKSAFDGSGADNFYDAGSCIDGRLTSAWNWCSQLPDKPFYCVFKLTGFTGFDGEFK